MERVDVVVLSVCDRVGGPGGWATLLHMGDRETILTGGEVRATDNRLVLFAALAGFDRLNQMLHVAIDAGAAVPELEIHVFTASEYLANAWNRGWLDGWVRHGWTTAAGKPVANRTLWERLARAVEVHQVGWRCVEDSSRIETRLAEAALTGRREAVRSQPE